MAAGFVLVGYPAQRAVQGAVAPLEFEINPPGAEDLVVVDPLVFVMNPPGAADVVAVDPLVFVMNPPGAADVVAVDPLVFVMNPPGADDLVAVPPLEFDINPPPAEDLVAVPPLEFDINPPPAEDLVAVPPLEFDINPPPAEDLVAVPPLEFDINPPPAEDLVAVPSLEFDINPPSADDLVAPDPLEFRISPPGDETDPGLPDPWRPDLIAFPELVIPFPGERDPGTQLMIVVRILASVPPTREDGVATVMGTPSQPSLWSAVLYRPAMPLAAAARVASQQSSPLQLFMSSTGNSSGNAFNANLGNTSLRPVTLNAVGVVVEPLAASAQQQMQRQLTQILPTNPLGLPLTGFCLEFLQSPPTAGQLFQVASKELQERFAPMRNILAASQRLNDLGSLLPDSDPAPYFDSIRQWSLWSFSEGFDQQGFADAFVEHTRNAFVDDGAEWTQEIEGLVRELAPARWENITKVLDEARLQ